jgi:hypothetical protein
MYLGIRATWEDGGYRSRRRPPLSARLLFKLLLAANPARRLGSSVRCRQSVSPGQQGSMWIRNQFGTPLVITGFGSIRREGFRLHNSKGNRYFKSQNEDRHSDGTAGVFVPCQERLSGRHGGLLFPPERREHGSHAHGRQETYQTLRPRVACS